MLRMRNLEIFNRFTSQDTCMRVALKICVSIECRTGREHRGTPKKEVKNRFPPCRRNDRMAIRDREVWNSFRLT